MGGRRLIPLVHLFNSVLHNPQISRIEQKNPKTLIKSYQSDKIDPHVHSNRVQGV